MWYCLVSSITSNSGNNVPQPPVSSNIKWTVCGDVPGISHLFCRWVPTIDRTDTKQWVLDVRDHDSRMEARFQTIQLKRMSKMS